MECVQCGSEDIVSDVRLLDQGQLGLPRDLTLQPQMEVGSAAGTVRAQLHADVCASCGHVMLWVSVPDAKALKNANAGPDVSAERPDKLPPRYP